jgi:hypothetical protein
MAIAMMIAIDIGRKYKSAIDGPDVGAGVGVAAGSVAVNDVSAEDE